MLLTREQVTHAMNLTAPEINRAVAYCGYFGGTYTAAVFQGMNEIGCFVYLVTYHDPGSEVATGRLYISYKQVRGSDEVYLNVEF